ncbi:MAG: hypothetical protein KGY68_08250 [Candidatus Thermoplasmatota archaeon]|nr:hypothetical protein [Candidatus Thermoplasmatota archaeon]
MERGYRTFDQDPIPMEDITENLTRQDGKPLVGEALEESLGSVDSLPSDNNKAIVLTEITDIFFDSDLLYLAKRFGEKAVDSTEGIKQKSEKAKTLSRIASTFTEHDFRSISDKVFEKAMKEAESIKDEAKRVEVFLYVIEDLIENGLKKKAEKNLDKVLSTSVDLAEKEHDMVPLAMTAETIAKIDNKKGEETCKKVLEYLHNLDPVDDRGWIIISLAKAFSRIGRHEKSIELVKKLICAGDSDIQFVELGITLSDEGQVERALELRNHVKNEELRDTLTGKIASDLILKGSVEEALKLMEDIEDVFETDVILKKLVKHFAGRDRKKARKHLQEISSIEMKALAYRELAISHLYKDDHKRAKELALKAIEMIANSESESVKVELIETMIDLGLKDRAFELAEQIETSEERAIAFGSIAARTY